MDKDLLKDINTKEDIIEGNLGQNSLVKNETKNQQIEEDSESEANILIHSQVIIKPRCENAAEKEILKENETIEGFNLENVQSGKCDVKETDDEESVKNQILENSNFSEIQCDKSILSSEDTINKDSVQENSKTDIVCPNIKNTSLGLLQSQYSGSDTDYESDSTISNNPEGTDSDTSGEPVVVNDHKYRDQVFEIESDSSSSSSSSVEELPYEKARKMIVDFEGNGEEELEEDPENLKKRNDPLRVKGELLLHELPPIQDLQITVPEEECIELGKIDSIVDQLVLVNSIPGTVLLNLDTVLFLEKGQKVLGEIFDVLGPINNPIYCVRFNSNKQIQEKGIEIEQTVYVAPKTEHTQFVILSEIMKIRGSDASWKNDIEPSSRHIDFSDDEEERNYRRSVNSRNHNDKSQDITEERKRQRTYSSSSQMSDTLSTSTQSSFCNQNFRGRNRGRFPRPYTPHQRQFQPRNRPMYNNFRLQNPPSYNYDQLNNSWHSNFNFNINGYQSFNQRSRNPTNNIYNQNLNIQEPEFIQRPIVNHDMLNFSSTIYPNPYAIRAPYILPNVLQSNMQSPPPPPNSEN